MKNKKLTLLLPVSLFLLLLVVCKTRQVENLGIFGRSRLQSVAGQDGCTPIHIDKRYTLWTFGDTILGGWKGEVTVSTTFEKSGTFRGMVGNSLAITGYPSDETIEKLQFNFLKEQGKVTDFIKPDKSGDGSFYKVWTIDGIKIEKRVYLYYIIIKVLKSGGPVPFSVYGTGLASWDIPEGWEPGIAPRFRKIGRIFKGDEPTFGDSVILKNGYLYLMGHLNVKGKVFGYFARVKPGNIASRGSYSFLKKNGAWTPDIREAGAYFGEVFGEPSLSYNKHLEKYLIIYCAEGGKIKAAAFRDFSRLGEVKPAVIYVPPKLPEIKNRILYMYYSGKEIFATGKSVYAIYINPAIYQPILLKIPYSRLK